MALDKKTIERHDVTLRRRARIEMRIVRQIIRDLLAGGCRLMVDYTVDDEPKTQPVTRYKDIARHMMECDEEYLLVYRPVLAGQSAPDVPSPFGWVRLIYGESGWDVVCDYTTNLEPYMKTANELADKISERC